MGLSRIRDTGRGKSKRKTPNTAASRQLAAEWDALQAKWDKIPGFSRGIGETLGKGVPKTGQNRGIMKAPEPKIPSRVTPGGSTAKKEPKVYTGTAMVGVSQMHKSNAVPVFSKEDAIAITKMRRG